MQPRTAPRHLPFGIGVDMRVDRYHSKQIRRICTHPTADAGADRSSGVPEPGGGHDGLAPLSLATRVPQVPRMGCHHRRV